MSSFFTESKETLKMWFIIVGIFQMVSLNVGAVVIGILFVYWGLTLDKLLPNREKVVVNTLLVIVALDIISAIYLLTQKFFDVNLLRVVLPILFILYIIKSVKQVSLNQRALGIKGDKSSAASGKDDHSLRNMLILIVFVAILGAIAYFGPNLL